MRIGTMVLLGCSAVLGCSPDPVVVVTSSKGLTRITTLDATTHALLFDSTSPFVPITNGTVIRAEDAAQAAASAAPQIFQPQGCVTATVSGAAVNYQLRSCSAALGVTGISGSYVATYQSAGSGLQVTVKSSALVVQGIPVAVDAQALYTEPGSGLLLTITSRGTAPGDDYEIVQALQSTLNWQRGDTCATEAASGTITVEGATFTESMAGVTYCTNQCPSTSGFAIASGNSTLVTVTFSGAVQATFTATGNNSGQVTLACVSAG